MSKDFYSDLILGFALYLIDSYVQSNPTRVNTKKAVIQEESVSMEELYTMQLS